MGKWPYAPAAPSSPLCELARDASWERAGRAVLRADSPRNQRAAEDSKIKVAMPGRSTKTRRVVVMGGSPRVDLLDVILDRERADTQDGSDLEVALAEMNPAQDLLLSRAERVDALQRHAAALDRTPELRAHPCEVQERDHQFESDGNRSRPIGRRDAPRTPHRAGTPRPPSPGRSTGSPSNRPDSSSGGCCAVRTPGA